MDRSLHVSIFRSARQDYSKQESSGRVHKHMQVVPKPKVKVSCGLQNSRGQEERERFPVSPETQVPGSQAILFQGLRKEAESVHTCQALQRGHGSGVRGRICLRVSEFRMGSLRSPSALALIFWSLCQAVLKCSPLKQGVYFGPTA